VPWMYTTGTATGSKALQLPASLPAASYELRLFAHNTLQRLAVSSPLLVASPTLTASPSTVLAGGTLSATWQGIPNPRSTDWLALVSTGAADASYKAWWYTNGSSSSNEELSLPATLPPGTYELRLFSNGSLQRLATSNTVTVPAAV